MRFAIALALLTVSCSSGGGSSTTPPPTTSPPSPGVAACSVPFETAALSEGAASAPKSDVADDRRTRRGRVYEQLWKHQAAAARRAAEGRAQPSTFGPTATTEDIGQIAVMRDEGDLVLPPNAFDLRSAAFLFARNGSGGYDVRPSTRAFLSSVGDKISLGDDASARIALPFTFPYYSGRYSEAFLNSDGNVTFVSEDHASADRNVARFLTGPPRVAPIFADLDPSKGGGVFRRTDGDALVITWCDVPEFDSTSNRVNVQLRLASDGSIEFIYGATVETSGAVVGVSPGETGVFSAVNISEASRTAIGGGSGAVGERFSAQPDFDFVAMAQKFYLTHNDDFDQIVLFTNTRTTTPGTFAFEFAVANEVRGIGVPVFDSSRDFGSRGRLRSVVDMDRLSSYPQDPAQPFLGENNALSVLGQECGHRWLAYLEFRDGATTSTALLGRDEAHWSFFFDSDASHMEGNDIEDRGNGQFRTVGAVSRYSALDQYAMGLRAASEVPPMFLVTQVNSGGSASDAPRIGVDIRGTRKDVRIEDIVAAMGPRSPDFASAPKAFRQAWVYVVAQTRETSDDLNKLDRLRAAWETFFSASTSGRGTMSARLR
jgi:hypothetical protein